MKRIVLPKHPGLCERLCLRWILRASLLCLLPALGGCLLLDPPPEATCKNSSIWTRNADGYFSDPQARKLALAAACGNTAEITRLMKQEHVNPDTIFSMEGDGIPLIAWPVLTRSPDGLKAMLENGANPNVAVPRKNARSPRNHPNAMVYASEIEDITYLKLLLDHGGDPNTRNGNAESLLFNTYINGDLWENLKLLVERGADVNARASGASTIIERCAALRPFYEVYWLLEHGADPSLEYPFDQPVRNPDSRTIQAIFWSVTNRKNPEDQRKCQQWLLAHGYKRPPMSDFYRDWRRGYGFPYQEKDIPLL